MRVRGIKILASGLGLGYLPLAPGSWGSLLGIPLSLLFSQAPLPLTLLSIVTFTVFAAYVSQLAEAVFAQRDARVIVIDEIAGMLWALLFLPWSLGNIILIFLLFRFFDIAKVFPANLVEKRLPGGWAVVLDDVVAGIYAGATAWLLTQVINLFQ